jgi:hypothetical protein
MMVMKNALNIFPRSRKGHIREITPFILRFTEAGGAGRGGAKIQPAPHNLIRSFHPSENSGGETPAAIPCL